jgi:hypothetical protein
MEPNNEDNKTFDKKTYLINVVGIRYENSDGSSRIKYLLNMKEGDTIRLVREPDNPYDEFAIKVVYGDNFQIGYLPRIYSKEISSFLDSNRNYKVPNFFIERSKIGYKIYCSITIKIW